MSEKKGNFIVYGLIEGRFFFFFFNLVTLQKHQQTLGHENLGNRTDVANIIGKMGSAIIRLSISHKTETKGGGSHKETSLAENLKSSGCYSFPFRFPHFSEDHWIQPTPGLVAT